MDSSQTHNSYKVGDKVKVEMGYSEVCMHLGVAGKVATIEILSRGVQIYTPEGEKFSFPILHGEAGVYVGSPDEKGNRFCIPKDTVRD